MISLAMRENTHSIRASAIKGGSLGWIEKKIVVPEFGSIMTNLKIGEISEPFKTQYGWHILRI